MNAFLSRKVRSIAFLAVLVGQSGWAIGQDAGDALEQGFKAPPDSAKPRTWWHWVGSNITREGITKDLEWMKRVGIGGMTMFDGGVAGPQSQNVDHKIVFMTPEWLDTVRYAASEADRLGLEMSMASSGGWSETGGPWVKPEQAMKKVVWSEMRVAGPTKFSGKLPQPPSVNGSIRNAGLRGVPPSAIANTSQPDPTYYADSVVLAYRIPVDDLNMADLRPTVTSSSGPIDAKALMDDDLTTAVTLPMPANSQTVWIQWEFAQPFTARAFSFAVPEARTFGGNMPTGEVQASDDGTNFRTLASLPGQQHDIRPIDIRTFAFPATTARFYRLVLTSPYNGRFARGGPGSRGPVAPPKQYEITEATFYSGARVNRWEDKAGFAPLFEYETVPTPPAPSTVEIQRSDVVDLTSKLAKDGSLDWDVPAGTWTILRMGYSLTGHKNGPAVPSATGFEVDKLNRKDVEAYYIGYTQKISRALGPLWGKSLRYMLMDSYEGDSQNWTEDMVQQFQVRRGYDPTRYFPALTGRVVDSSDISDRFLWDYRRTLADLLADNHYGTLADELHKSGLGLYSEAAGVSLPILQDALYTKSKIDIPMGEFGMQRPLGTVAPYLWSDIREAASAAHIYGKPLVGAESFTGGGYESPADLKFVGDYWFTQGVNRMMFHTSAHQPLDTKPGNTMVGTHIHRNITWAELASPYMTYVARNMFILQQGRFVADIAYYLGESIPASIPYWESIQPEPPQGYDYDFLNADVLLNQFSVKDGQLILPDGMTYRVLVLPDTRQMTPKVLRKIRDLVAAGATVVGPKPTRSPSLVGYPTSDGDVRDIANEVWGDADGRSIQQHSFGKGKIVWGLSLQNVLVSLGTQPDFEFTRPETDVSLLFIHRQLENGDVYFVTNRKDRVEDLRAVFRVAGKEPELWHADTGVIEPAEYSIADGRTTVPLHLDPRGSTLVVFRKPASATSRELPRPVMSSLDTVDGPWDVSFPPNLGAPTHIRLEKLVSWTSSTEDGVRYFSGTATYMTTLRAPRTWFRTGKNIMLNLGTVKDSAQVFVNGNSLGILWKAPYEVEVTGALKPGRNSLQVQITNEWTNRIAGDRLLTKGKAVLPIGSGAPNPFVDNRAVPLPESGLLGPVNLLSLTRQ
jgi:alpha-L-rhamnosidase/F5/8 type C domain